MEQNFRRGFDKQKQYDSLKAKTLCYSSLYTNYDDERIQKVIKSKYVSYNPFLSYLRLAEKAAKDKQSIGAKFTVVDRDNDYKLSTWVIAKVTAKIINGKFIEDPEQIEMVKSIGFDVTDIEITSVSVDGKDTSYYKIDDSVIFEANKNSRIIINNDNNIPFEKEEFKSNTVNYYGQTISVRKQKISIDKYIGDECFDSTFNFIKYKINKDSEDQKNDEFTIELIDDPTTEISIYEIFFNEDQNDVYFNKETKERYKVTYKNKESGRLVIKSSKGLEGIDLDGYVYLNTNTNQLARQRNAINSIIERPSYYQKILLDMSDKRPFCNLKEFNYQSQNLDYKVLTDISREGTLKQREFVEKALQTPDFMILQGPPGSGKTTAILELIYQLIKQNKKVLLCASTHVAIDNVLEKIIEHKDSNELLNIINPVRVGDENNVYSDCVKEYVYSTLHENISSEYTNMVDESFNLVCGTTIGVLSFPLIDKRINDIKTIDGKQQKEKSQSTIEPLFDYLILDEASKTTFSEFLVPATLCKKWIIVGDVKQLAPYVEKNDLIPTLLECEPINTKDKRFALSFIKLFNNQKDREKMCKSAYIFNRSAIEYIDSRISGNSIIAVTNATNLSNIFTISKDDIENNSYRTAALSSYGSIILIEEGLVDITLPLLNSNVTVFHNEIDLRSPMLYNEYSILHARNRFDQEYKKDFKEYSRKLEDEILWRLIRLYELSDKQGKAKNYKQYLIDIKNLLNEEEKIKLEETINTLQNIAIPSIIMMLQEGINKNNEYQSILTAGLTEEEKANRFVKLDYQHRMHKDISKVSREYIYENEALKDSKKWESKMDYMNDKSRFEIRNVKGSIVDNGNRNELEADAILNELEDFIKYAKTHKKKDEKPYSIAILSFYNGQVVYLRKKLKEMFNQQRANFNFYSEGIHVTLNTVDKFQGQEADIVYLSMVQTNRVGFLDSISRVNVAITRAKEKIIIFGDGDFFRSQKHSELLNNLFKGVK